MKNLNLIEFLKDCPKGMKLYTTVWGEVEFIKICDVDMITVLPISNPYNTNDTKLLYSDGRFTLDGECILFPSKENRDWSEFPKPFKDGDVVTYKLRGNLVAFIYKNRINKLLVKSHFALYLKNIGFSIDGDLALKEEEIVFATKEEKDKLFKAIKDAGYKWNPETKTLTKLIEPNFKVGDRIRNTRSNSVGVIEKLTDTGYECRFEYGYFFISFKDQHNFILVPNKFDLATLVPFKSKVLVRGDEHCFWKPATFGFFNGDSFYVLGGNMYKQCIPYEGNEHLMGKTDGCDESYKTWK